MNNKLTISNMPIKQDTAGRYSLNDLHKASGNKEKDKPANWLRSEKTIELIDEILIAQNREVKDPAQKQAPVMSKSGRYGGTYVCKELVYSYAMWISAAFSLKVIRAYDALVSSVMQKKPNFRQSTAKELIPLRQTAERLIAHGVGNIYPDIWKHVHAEFGVQHINELLPEQIPLAISYLDALEGEYIPKQQEIANLSADKERDIYNVNALAKQYEAIYTAWKVDLYPALVSMDSPIAKRLYDRFKTGYAFLMYLQTSLNGKHPALIN